MSVSARSVYVSRLRRAFLLRVHPDRFQCTETRSQQSRLVQALANRMQNDDFIAWQQQESTQTTSYNNNGDERNKHNLSSLSYPFVMEKRDGTIIHDKIKLDQSVDNILNAMANSLKKSGAASLPKPPPSMDIDKIEMVQNKSSSSSSSTSHGNNNTSTVDNINHQYDTQSAKGRDLYNFLRQDFSLDIVQTRKAARIEAQAVAATVRKLYKFSAVDATETGWSSQSVAVLLRRLLSLHHEHSHKFNVTSFYPIRLVFSERWLIEDNIGSSVSLDVYGGVLRLKPALTSIQWLDSLQLVTEEKLDEINKYRNLLLERTKLVQGNLGVKIKKGFTCSSKEYHTFLERLTTTEHYSNVNNDDESSLFNNSMPALEPVQAIVESDYCCRKPIVTTSGMIQLGAGMSRSQCITAVTKLANVAREKATQEKIAIQLSRDLIHSVQWKLGLQKVYRTSRVRVTHDEFRDCISRLVAASEDKQTQPLYSILAGNSLGVATTGQFCHLADDGSIVIPHDWK